VHVEEDAAAAQIVLRPGCARHASGAPRTAQGLPANGWSGGREAQSIAFFKTPVIE